MNEALETVSKLLGDETADGKGGEKAKGKPGFLDKFKNAFKKASEAKDEGLLARTKIFLTSLLKDWFGLGEEEKEVTKKTEKEVATAIDATMKGAKEKVGLPSEVAPGDAAAYDEVLAMGVASKASLDSKHEGFVDSAMAKIDTRVDGKNSDKCTFEETTTMAGMALMTLAQLRDKYPDKFTFIKALQKFSEVSEKGKYPISKLFDANVLDLFRIDLDDNMLASSSLLEKFGMGTLGVAALGKFGKEDAIAAFGALKTSPIAEEAKTVSFFHDHIFVNTEVDDLKAALQIINSMLVSEDKKLDPLKLTELIYKIDRRDYDKLVTALVGPDNYLARKAAVS